MADHSEPTRKHPAHEQFHHLPPSPLPALATGNRDTAVIMLASATAIFLALAVALSIMLWRGRSDGMVATGAAPTRPPTPEASAAAQPVAPAEAAASAASEPEESAHAEETTQSSAEATAEASAEATPEATLDAEETTDPDAAAADESATLGHRDELPITGVEIPLLAGTGAALAFSGLALVRLTRRRAAAAAEGVEISAVDALWLFLEQTRRRPDNGPVPRHVSPADQTARLRRVAEQASRCR